MQRVLAAIVIFVSLFIGWAAQAQEAFWVQVQATRTLRDAEDSARRYAATLPEVNGFRLGAAGWYAIALGPYDEAGATARMATLKASGAIPADSYISDGGGYNQQFWPVGANTLAAAPVAVPDAPAPTAEATTEPTAEPMAEPISEPTAEAAPAPAPVPVPEETRREALKSERALDRDARKALQVALKSEGFYTSAIDGAFGPGTRGSMAAWQEDKGLDPTGVLTTRQRAQLLAEYQAFLDTMGLAQITDNSAGIAIVLPTAMVSFTRYEAPFAHYEGDAGVRVVLISQRGDKATLYGLYDILQTLSVVPPEGQRRRRDADFTIEGANDDIVSYTYAKLVDGAVKGFMLVWPQGPAMADAEGNMVHKADRRRNMVLEAMKESFASTGTTALDDNAGLDSSTQSIDLVSGLEIRRPDRSRSGLWVDGNGATLTTTEAVRDCGRITLNDSYDATITAVDDKLGVALLAPARPLAPLSVAGFLTRDPRLQSALAVAGYSYGGRLSSPTLTFGTLADIKGLSGETSLDRLEITAQDGDTGGPVLDQGGAVIGMLLAPPEGGQRLPADVGLVAKGTALADFLAANGVTPTPSTATGTLTPYDLGALAADMTVLVSCWK